MNTHISGKRILGVAPVVIIIVAFVISIVIMPMIYSAPKNIPVAIITQDTGVKTPQMELNLGNTIVENVKKMSSAGGGDTPPIEWTTYSDVDKLNKAFENDEYYAALIIPKDFTAKQMKISTASLEKNTINILINQGKNPMIASTLEQTLNEAVSKIGTMMSENAITMLKQSNANLPVEQIKVLADPIEANIQLNNKVNDDLIGGTAHIFTSVICWITLLIASVLMFKYFGKEKNLGMPYTAKKRTVQLIWCFINSCIIGIVVAFIVSVEFGINIPYMETATYLSIATFCLLILIEGILTWTGLAGISIAIAVLVFGLLASALPYELLPEFWQNWIYPWMPLRFFTDGVGEIYYMNGRVINDGLKVLLWLGASGIALMYLSLIQSRSKINRK